MSKVIVKSKSVLVKEKDGDLKTVDYIDARTSDCEIGADSCNDFYLVGNYNSVTGVRTLSAMYFVDGAPVVDTIANAKAAIVALKAIP